MTSKEFDETKFSAGQKVNYKGRWNNEYKEYPIASIDFEEQLFGLLILTEDGDHNEISWVRCENCNIL